MNVILDAHEGFEYAGTSQFKAIIHGQYENSLKRGEQVNNEEQKPNLLIQNNGLERRHTCHTSLAVLSFGGWFFRCASKSRSSTP
jgi:hypothetical protein